MEERHFRIVAKDAADANRIYQYIVKNYGRESVGSYIPGSSEVTLVCQPGTGAEYDFCTGGKYQYKEALYWMGVSEHQLQRSF